MMIYTTTSTFKKVRFSQRQGGAIGEISIAHAPRSRQKITLLCTSPFFFSYCTYGMIAAYYYYYVLPLLQGFFRIGRGGGQRQQYKTILLWSCQLIMGDHLVLDHYLLGKDMYARIHVMLRNSNKQRMVGEAIYSLYVGDALIPVLLNYCRFMRLSA